MIRIEITKVTKSTWKQKENVIVRETPTGTKAKDYGSGTEPVFEREYAVVEVEKSDTATTQLLKQELDDIDFNLTSVIKAINGL